VTAHIAAKTDAILTRRLREILPGGALGAVRRIGMDDDRFLSPAEAVGMGQAVASRRRASGAARALARSLLRALSVPPRDIPWSSSGAPLWPPAVVGSLGHDELVAVAVVGSSATFGGLGVDVEPAGPLDEELIPIVASPDERRAIGDDPARAKLLFCIKEAVFKAVNPRDRRFLEFEDVAVDLEARCARTSYGRVVHWRVVAEPRILAVAWS
jgi:4'-phosphopantetheinyl transferase EntD